MDNILFFILFAFIGLFVGTIIVFIIYYLKKDELLKKAESIVDLSILEAENLKKESILNAKEEISKLKQDLENEIKEKKHELKEVEERLINREQNIDRRDELLTKKENSLEDKESLLDLKNQEIQEEKMNIEEIKNKELNILENISKLSKEEAKELVLKKTEELCSYEIASYIRDRENEAKLIVDRKAKMLLVECMQRYSNDVTSEQTITVISLPNDDIKGRIIGREGRNIRTIEAVTGVDLIIDDTPEAIVISSFDPLRREIARITIENLIKDGRIHPSRIEEIYDKACKEINEKIREYGEAAVYELGITKIEPDLLDIIGKLYFRTSYGQNALQHSIEVAYFTGILAGEIGENVGMARRAGLLHDIGKSINIEVDGNHIDVGIDIAKRFKESDIVINAIASHHGDCDKTHIISSLVEIADTLSAARPGARNDSSDNYIKRLNELETISKSFEGVEKAYAIQAGREIRVIVNPDTVDDVEIHKISKNITKKIEDTMQYPGTIKVTVVREVRSTNEAK